MDIATAAASPIVRSIDGVGEVTFPRLSTRELAAYGNEIRSGRRERAVQDAKDAKLPPDQAFRAINGATFGEVSLEEVADFMDSPANAVRVIEASVTKSKATVDKNAVLDSLSPIDLRLLAREILGTHTLFVKPKPPEISSQPKTDPASGFGVTGSASPLP